MSQFTLGEAHTGILIPMMLAPRPPSAPPSPTGTFAETDNDRRSAANAGPAVGEIPRVHATRVLAEAASKSSVLWIRLKDGSTHPAWYVWQPEDRARGGNDTDTIPRGPAVLVISGVGEQSLPWLPAQVELVFRSKDSGQRLVTIGAEVEEITPEDPRWQAAADLLRPQRLNSADPAGMDARWRAGCVIHMIRPVGALRERGGDRLESSGAAAVYPVKATTVGGAPWHWRGRPTTRRGTSPAR